MIGHTIRGVSYYRCNHRSNPDRIPFGPDGKPEPCMCREVRASVIEPVVWNSVCQLSNDPDVLIQELRNRNSESSQTRESTERELQRQLEKGLITGEQEDQIRNLTRRVSAGLEVLDFAGRQELLRLLVEKVFYDRQKLEIQTIIPLNEQLHPLRREVG